MSGLGSLELGHQLCFALYAATNEIVRTYRPLLADYGLTYPQYLVMLVIWEDGDMTASAIAKRLRLPPSAITPLVDKLVERGVVKRIPSEHDRRQIAIHMTDEGQALKDKISAVRREVACRTGMEQDEITQLVGVLEGLMDRITDDPQKMGRTSKGDTASDHAAQ